MSTKIYNINTIGSLTNNNGVLSGFSASNYAQLSVPFMPQSYNSWEAVIKTSYTHSANNYQRLFGKSGTWQIVSGVDNDNKSAMYLSSDGSSWNLATPLSGSTYSSNIPTLYFKYEFTGTQYKLSSSTDGNTWVTEATLTSSTKLANSSTPLFLGRSAGSFWQGTIDLNGCYIKADGNIIWQGVSNYYDLDINPTPADAEVLYNPPKTYALNTQIVGTLTDNNGEISGFSRTSYLVPGYSLNQASSLGGSMEMNICIIPAAKESSRNDKNIITTANNYACIFLMNDSNAIAYWSGSTETVLSRGNILNSGERAYIKIKMNSAGTASESVSVIAGGNYTIDTLPDLSSGLWTTTNLNVSQIIGTNRIGGGYTTSNNQFNGIVDLNNTNITLDGVEIWRGTVTGYTENTNVTYTVSKPGYITQSDTITITQDTNLNITLLQSPASINLGDTPINKIYYGTREEVIPASYNITTVGTLTNNDGILSGFSTSNYASIGSVLDTTQDWEFVTCFITGSDITTPSCVQAAANVPYWGYGIRYTNQNIQIGGTSAGTDFDVFNVIISGISANTKYWIKTTRSGNTYTNYLSTDGSNWIIKNQTTNTANLLSGVIRLGINDSGVQPLSGQIDLNECYIKINNELVWQGVTPSSTQVVGNEIKKLYLGDTLVYDNSETN